MIADRRAELEANIERDPYDPDGYAVLGDYLQEIGDCRGTLIALQIVSRTDSGLDQASARYLDEHERELCGPFRAAFQWSYGFARLVRVAADDRIWPGGLRDALAHPSARFVLGLEIEMSRYGLQGFVDVIAEQRRPTLRILKLGTDNPSLASPADVGTLDRMLPAVPNLRALDVAGKMATFDGIDLPELEQLRIALGTLTGHCSARCSGSADTSTHPRPRA